MKFTRRRFIGTLGASTLAAASIGSAGKIFGQSAASDDLFFTPAASLSDPINFLTSKHFEPFVNTAFRVGSVNGIEQQMILKEVTELSRKSNSQRGYSGESFSLVFEGARNRKIASGNLEFNHKALGKFAFLTVPVGQSGTTYEVVVNRVRR